MIPAKFNYFCPLILDYESRARKSSMARVQNPKHRANITSLVIIESLFAVFHICLFLCIINAPVRTNVWLSPLSASVISNSPGIIVPIASSSWSDVTGPNISLGGSSMTSVTCSENVTLVFCGPSVALDIISSIYDYIVIVVAMFNNNYASMVTFIALNNWLHNAIIFTTFFNSDLKT